MKKSPMPLNPPQTVIQSARSALRDLPENFGLDERPRTSILFSDLRLFVRAAALLIKWDAETDSRGLPTRATYDAMTRVARKLQVKS